MTTHASRPLQEAASAESESSSRVPVWTRPTALGYPEILRGLGGIVAPLLAGFSLAAIATIVTSDHRPPLADWAVASLAAAVALLLFAMQVAVLSLGRNSSPADVLIWRPEATVSEEELELARAAHADDFREMSRLGNYSMRAYGWGLIAFLCGVVLLMVPDKWSAAWVVGVIVAGAALLLEVWWLVANELKRYHPVARFPEPSHKDGWDGEPPRLDQVGVASVIDPERRDDAGLGPRRD